MFERRLTTHIDWALLAAVGTLCAIGVAMVYSATQGSRLSLTQLSAIVIGLLGLGVCLAIDYRSLVERSHLVYLVVVAALGYVLLFGVVRGGARRWIDLGWMNLQPSEFAKIAVVLALAKLFGDDRRGRLTSGELLAATAITALPVALIAGQPDLGTAVTVLPVLVAVVYLVGMRTRYVAALLVAAVVVVPVVWIYGLQDYQRARLAAFLDPTKDARGVGYQQIQARITVGSGGLWGKGYGEGTQGRLKFLPVAHNDFIFSAYAEELGFAGVLVALALYLFVVLRALEAARLAKDRIGAYLVVGLVSWFASQVIYNVSMSAGLAPVKGLTLPLMSYGGSSMVATLASLGLILNVRMRRFTN